MAKGFAWLRPDPSTDVVDELVEIDVEHLGQCRREELVHATQHTPCHRLVVIVSAS